MPTLKTQFELTDNLEEKVVGSILIVGREPMHHVYVPIKMYDKNGEHLHGFIKDKELELFAVNILKALKSKYLNP